MRTWLILSVLAFVLPACGKAACAAPMSPDAPVAASEPRATLRIVVDLPMKGGCDEAFDLALYENRGVELVQWDEGQSKCEGRKGTIRYLPKRLGRDALLKEIQRLSTKSSVLEG